MIIDFLTYFFEIFIKRKILINMKQYFHQFEYFKIKG